MSLKYVKEIIAGASVDIGEITDAAVTDPTASASLIAALKGLLKQLQGTGTSYTLVDVSKMSKGAVTVAHSAIVATATSVEIDCRGFNTISVECAVSAITSGNWMIEILSCAASGGTFGRGFFEGLEHKVSSLNTNENFTLTFRGIGNFVKIKATRTTDGTLTCKVTPLNL